MKISIAAVLAAGLFATGGVAAAGSVDLELLLAVDVSPSVNTDEYDLQIRGLSEAFRHPDVVDAIRAGAPNGIAVALMQWAGPREQALSVGWSEVRDQATADSFAEQIDAVARPTTNGGTAIGDALDRAIALLAENRFDGARQVIDVSGDGRTNQGESPAPIRTLAVLSGITVNGLVILDDEPQLDAYYLKRVIGGPGAFVLHANGFEDFAEAIRLKLIREITGATVAQSIHGDGIAVVMLAPN